MSHWKNVVSGFDVANETMNFGTRTVAQSDTAVYETTTLATISTDEKVPFDFVPKTMARYSELGIGVCVGNSFHLFNKTCMDLLLSKHFERSVTCFEFIANCSCVVFSLDDSTLVYLNTDTGLEERDMFFSEGNNSQICGLSTPPNTSCSFVIFLSCGKAYEANFNPRESESHILGDDNSIVRNSTETNVKRISYKLFVDSSFSRASVSKVFLCSSEELGYYESRPDFLKLYRLNGGYKDFAPLKQYNGIIPVKKIGVSQLGDFLVCLTSDGSLLNVCPITGIFKNQLREKAVSDLVVMDCLVGDSFMTSLLLLTAGEDPELVLVDVHSFQTVFRLKVSQNVSMVLDQSNAEDYLFVEYLENKLMIKSITHTEADYRLERLILRGRYKEAIAFANVFNLSKEDIYKGVVKSLASSLYLSHNLTEMEINLNFEELMRGLGQIKDDSFVVDFCVTSMAPDMVKTQKLIEYATERASSSSKKEILLDIALSAQLRVGTFLLVYGSAATPADWFKFSSNPVKLAKGFFVQGNLKGAAIVCQRHQNKIIREITKDDALSFLHFSPSESTSISDLIDWLKHFTPIILSCRLEALPAWITWILKVARTFENLLPENWPNHALIFTEAAVCAIADFKALSLIKSSLDRMYLDSFKVSPSSPLTELNVLFWSLTQLQKLKKEYSFVVPYHYFSECYENEGSRNLILKLFERIHESELTALIEGFIAPIFHGIPKDLSEIICSYIDICTSGTENKVLSESRFITFAKWISNPASKLRAVTTILMWARVPWNKPVEDLANEALKMQHPLVEAVKRQFKLVPKKLILKKYRIPDDSMLNENYIGQLSIYINKIYERGNPEMLEDAIALASAYSEEGQLLPYSILFHRHLNEEPPRALSFDAVSNNLSREQSRRLINDLYYFCINKIRSGPCHPYISEVESAMRRHMMEEPTTTDSGYNTINISERLKDVRNVGLAFKRKEVWFILSLCFVLRCSQELGVDCKPHELALMKHSDIMRQLIDSCDLSDNVENLNENINKLEQVSCLLKYSKELTWCQLASRCCQESKFNLVARFIGEVADGGKDFFKIQGKIFLQLTYSVVMRCSESGKMDPQVAEVLSRALISSIVASSDTYRDLNFKLDLIKICRMFESSTYKPTIYQFFIDQIDAQSFFLRSDILVPIVARLENPQYCCDPQLLGNAIEQFITVDSESLPKNVSTLRSLFYLTVLLGKFNLMNPQWQKKFKSYANQVVSPVFLNIFNVRRNINMDLAFIMLNHLTVDKATSWLASLINNHKFTSDKAAANNLNRVALQYFSAHQKELKSSENFSAIYEYFRMHQKRCYWVLKGHSLGVPSKDCCLESVDGQKKFLTRLATLPSIKVDMLINYCKDVGLDEDLGYMEYLKYILLSWQPKYTCSDFGSIKRLVVEDDAQELSTKCLGIASKIRCRQNFSESFLSELRAEVNAYYYEVTCVIMEISAACFNANVGSWMVAINFLKSYTRHSSPSQDEITEWDVNHPESASFPEIANYRLPLKVLPFKECVLEKEVCLENYRNWLAAPPALHCLTRDTICSFAIYNLKNRDPKPVGTWSLTHQQKELLAQILDCTNNISSLENVVASLYFTVSYVMAPGVDQVEAAQKCYLKAQEWANKDKCSDSAEKLRKVEEKYLRVSTIHILHTYGLGDIKYLQYASDPNQLIYELYHDSSITDCRASVSLGVRDVGAPDINRAVERIAALHDVDTTKIAIELLSEWFQPPAYDNTLNETVNSPLERENSDWSDNAKCIVRASYMLRGREDAVNVENYLVARAFPRDESSSKPHAMKLKALKCLMGIRTVEELERITSRNITSIRNYALNLEILSGLEVFGLSYSITGFERVDKTEVVERLCGLVSNSSEALILGVQICFKFDIVSQTTWDALITKMIELKMASKLREILRTIEHDRASSEVIRMAWEFLSSSLLDGDSWEKVRDTNGEEVTNLVRSCPKRSYLNIPASADYL